MLLALSLFIAALIVRDAITGRGDLMSLRNFFFGSFLLFQIVSGLRAIIPNDFGEYTLADPDGTTIAFAASCWVFILIFIAVYGHGFIAKHLAHKLPGENASPATASLLVLAAVVLGSGILFKTVLVYVPVFGPLSDKIGGGQLALCVGLAMWAWAPRLLNPVVAAYSGAIILAAVGASLVGTFGRRDLVSVLAIVPWAMYHAWWKHGGFSYALKRVLVFGGAGTIVVASYSAVRSHSLKDRGIGAVATAMGGANVQEGLLDLTHGQFSANISMWLIENRPDPWPYKTLHSIHFGGTMIVPRQFYPDKPVGLGSDVPDQKKLRDKGDSFNVGPGVIGHIFNDNPWIAMWLYPAIFGLGLRFADEAIRSRYASPFVILPMGTGLGEVVGFARGELGLFVFNAAAAMASAYVTMVVVRVVLGWFGWHPTYDTGDEPDWFDEHNPWHHDDDPYADYADYGDDADTRAA